jgi:hypothetical protein
MPRRSGIYIVPTHRWYIERTVWLIAGIYLLTATALALWTNPLWVVAIIVMGMVSVNVSLTGFCLIGNALKLLGFTPMLGRTPPTPGNLYFMQTDRWYLERRIYLAVGINISIASVLSLVHSVWWLAFTGFVGVAMVWFAATGYCIMANGLYWMGAEPRLGKSREAKDLGVEGSRDQGVEGWKRHGGCAAADRASSDERRGSAAAPFHPSTP